MTTVIFARIHNAGRSQMAAGFFNVLSDPARARALSAGTKPADAVQLQVLEAMREAGVDLCAAKPRLPTAELVTQAQRVITMGCGDECPYVPGVEREDWLLLDPKGSIRDEIRSRVEALLAREGWSGRIG